VPPPSASVARVNGRAAAAPARQVPSLRYRAAAVDMMARHLARALTGLLAASHTAPFEQLPRLAVFDAMGHDTSAGLTSALAMATCRSHRRAGATIPDASKAIEDTLVGQFGHSRYATGILADLELDTGTFSWVNRGHPLPVLIRGGRWASTLHCPPAGPMGSGFNLPVQQSTEQLEPGDRLLLFTDGITEARDTDGREFGVERFTDFIIRHHADNLPVDETLRRLMHAVMDHHQDRLDDDATVVFCAWHGPGATGAQRDQHETGPHHSSKT